MLFRSAKIKPYEFFYPAINKAEFCPRNEVETGTTLKAFFQVPPIPETEILKHEYDRLDAWHTSGEFINHQQKTPASLTPTGVDCNRIEFLALCIGMQTHSA
jgi:hypothetical protein